MSTQMVGDGSGRLLPDPSAASPRPRRRRGQRGAVTAEAAVVLPVLLMATMGMVWLVSLGTTQARATDAARETARAVARDENPGAARSLGSRVAPAGARIAIDDRGDTVAVSVTAEVRGPGGLFAFLPPVRVSAEAVAAEEPS